MCVRVNVLSLLTVDEVPGHINNLIRFYSSLYLMSFTYLHFVDTVIKTIMKFDVLEKKRKLKKRWRKISRLKKNVS